MMQRRRRVPATPAWRVVLAAILACGLVLGTMGMAWAGSSPAELTLIHYLTDRHDLLEEMATEYERQTGVRVTVELYSDPGVERQKYVAAAQSGNAPDVVVSWTGIGEEMAKLIQAGYVANLTKEIAPWQDRFLPSLIEAVSFLPGNQSGVTPGVYLVPLDTNNMQMFYNTDLFARAGLGSFPATWQEFVEAGKKLRAAGIEPFATGFGTWGQSALFDVYKFHRLGAAGVEAMYRGQIPYTAPESTEVFQLFEQMRHEGILARGAASMDFPTAERLFAFGQVAILFDGSWAMGVFKYINDGFRSYGVAMPPRLEQAEHPLVIPGGVGALFGVTSVVSKGQEFTGFICQRMPASKRQLLEALHRAARSAPWCPATVSAARRILLRGYPRSATWQAFRDVEDHHHGWTFGAAREGKPVAIQTLLTADDLLRFPRDGKRYELVEKRPLEKALQLAVGILSRDDMWWIDHWFAGAARSAPADESRRR